MLTSGSSYYLLFTNERDVSESIACAGFLTSIYAWHEHAHTFGLADNSRRCFSFSCWKGEGWRRKLHMALVDIMVDISLPWHVLLHIIRPIPPMLRSRLAFWIWVSLAVRIAADVFRRH